MRPRWRRIRPPGPIAQIRSLAYLGARRDLRADPQGAEGRETSKGCGVDRACRRGQVEDQGEILAYHYTTALDLAQVAGQR
jgi:hypothetical protein